MSFSVLLDLVMVFLLAGTIFYAWRLSEQISRFRNSRAEMDRLVRELNMAVDRAGGAVLALREAAQTSGDDLQKIMRQATELSDELQLMTESANSLAGRLESAAGQRPTNPIGEDIATMPTRRLSRSVDEESLPRFAIRDPEFDGAVTSDQDGWATGSDELSSQAERDLMRAVQQNRKTTRLM